MNIIDAFGGSTMDVLAVCSVLVFEILGASAIVRWLGSKPTIAKLESLYWPSSLIGWLAIAGTGALALAVYATAPHSYRAINWDWVQLAPLALLDKLVGGTIPTDSQLALLGGELGWLLVFLGFCSAIKCVPSFRRTGVSRHITSHSADA
jgi:hypothetical protein